MNAILTDPSRNILRIIDADPDQYGDLIGSSDLILSLRTIGGEVYAVISAADASVDEPSAVDEHGNVMLWGCLLVFGWDDEVQQEESICRQDAYWIGMHLASSADPELSQRTLVVLDREEDGVDE